MPPGDRRLRRSGVRQSLFPWLAPCTLFLPIGREPPQRKEADGGLERLGMTGLRNLSKGIMRLVTHRDVHTPVGKTVACPGNSYSMRHRILSLTEFLSYGQSKGHSCIRCIDLVHTYLLRICRALLYRQAHLKEASLRCMLLDGIPLPLPARAAPPRLLPHR